VYEFEANTEGEATRNNIIALSLDYITKSTSTAPSNSLPIRIGLMLASDFNSSSGSATNLYNAITNTAKVDYEINSKINTEGIDYFSQGHWNGNVYIENEHLKNKKFYVVVYAPIPNNVYSDNFSLKVSYKANLRHTFKFALQNGQQVPVSSTEQKIIVNNVERQITTSGYKQLFLKNTSIVAKPKTQLIGIADPNPLMHKQWNQVSSDFDHKKQFAASLNTMFQTAEFSSFYTANLYSTSVEGTLPSFTFQNPWELEADGYTQLNEPKTYSGDESFKVFAGTNQFKNDQATQPTYVLNKGAVTGSNGIEYFVLGETATGATFHQAQSDDETIVKFSGNATINRTYKAKNHSTVSNVVGLDNRRLVATDWATSGEFRAYESTYFGVSRIWIQHKSIGTQEWGNEFLMELPQTDPLTYNYSAARNPQIATSLGGLWVVYEALNSDNQWYYVASLISNAADEINISYLHTEIFTDATESTFIPAGTLLTISGDDSGSNGSTLAVGWKRPGTSAFDIAVLKHIINVKIGDDPNFHNIIHHIHYTGSQYPILSTIQYGLEIAINSGKVGIASVYNSYGQNKVNFREAAYSDPVKSSTTNKITNPGTLNWISSPVSLTGSYSTLPYAPSIIAWDDAFRVAWSALNYTSGNPNVVMMRNIGSEAVNTTTKIIDLQVYGHGYNYLEGIQITRVNTSYAPSSPRTFALTALHNFPTNPTSTAMTTIVVTNENNPSNVTLSRYLLHNVTNRSVAAYSTSPQVNGVYKTSNQSLYKLNEIITPNYSAKGVAGSNNNKFFSAAAVNYKKGKQDYEQFYVQALNQGKESLPFVIETDSTDTLWLSDWFTWEKAISLQAYSSDQGNLPFSFALVNEEGKTIAEIRAKGEKMSAFDEIKAEKLLDAMKTIVVFGDGTGERVRIQVLPKSDKAELSLSQLLLPTEQEKTNGDAVADISDWTQTEVPDEFGIQAYPNPFNPSTTLQVSLPNNTALTVQVFDIMGRLVSQLFKGEKQAGVHEFTFNASNLASGNYFIRLQYTNAKGAVQLQTKAITLIK